MAGGYGYPIARRQNAPYGGYRNGNGNGGYRRKPRVTYKRKTVRRNGFQRLGGYYGRFPPNGKEFKFFDVAASINFSAGVGTILDSLNEIPQGITESTRVGRKCTIVSINWHYCLSIPESDAQATPAEGDMMRVILFLDKQANGATATTADLLEATVDWNSFRNLANSQRFTILMDRTHTLNYMVMASDGAGLVSQARVQYQTDFYKKCNIPLEFDNTTGAITEIKSNNIGLAMMSSEGLGNLLFKYRIRFSDS